MAAERNRARGRQRVKLSRGRAPNEAKRGASRKSGGGVAAEQKRARTRERVRLCRERAAKKARNESE